MWGRLCFTRDGSKLPHLSHLPIAWNFPPLQLQFHQQKQRRLWLLVHKGHRGKSLRVQLESSTTSSDGNNFYVFWISPPWTATFLSSIILPFWTFNPAPLVSLFAWSLLKPPFQSAVRLTCPTCQWAKTFSKSLQETLRRMPEKVGWLHI